MKMGEESLYGLVRCQLPFLAFHENGGDVSGVRCCSQCWSGRKRGATLVGVVIVN